MNIAPVASSLATSLTSLQSASGLAPNDGAAAFDAMFYRMLLQSLKWSSASSNGQHPEQAMFGDMITDVLAQAAARQQQSFGAMLLNGIDQQGKGKP